LLGWSMQGFAFGETVDQLVSGVPAEWKAGSSR
jgi:hypothetical protein